MLGSFWNQVGSKLGQVGAKLASVSILRGPRGALGGTHNFKIDFLLALESNMGPSWGHEGPRIGSIKACFFEARLGLDVGTS